METTFKVFIKSDLNYDTGSLNMHVTVWILSDLILCLVIHSFIPLLLGSVSQVTTKERMYVTFVCCTGQELFYRAVSPPLKALAYFDESSHAVRS